MTLLLRTLAARVPALAGALVGALALAACGAAGVAGPTPTQPPPDAPAPTPAAFWRTDLPVGPREGERAPHAAARTLEGQVTSIEQVAGGKPILVYFFASW